jgi:hypothetical protein
MATRIVNSGDSNPIKVSDASGIVDHFLCEESVRIEDAEGTSVTRSASTSEEAEYKAWQAYHEKKDDE